MNKTTIEKVTDIIIELQIPANVLGYRYLRDAILMAIEDKQYMNKTIALYTKVAEKNNSTASKVERAIRHGIEVSRYKNVEAYKKYVSSRIDENYKLTNAEIIASIADRISISERS